MARRAQRAPGVAARLAPEALEARLQVERACAMAGRLCEQALTTQRRLQAAAAEHMRRVVACKNTLQAAPVTWWRPVGDRREARRPIE